jgi:hypothetical protein
MVNPLFGLILNLFKMVSGNIALLASIRQFLLLVKKTLVNFYFGPNVNILKLKRKAKSYQSEFLVFFKATQVFKTGKKCC